jgi:hypothetical protein
MRNKSHVRDEVANAWECEFQQYVFCPYTFLDAYCDFATKTRFDVQESDDDKPLSVSVQISQYTIVPRTDRVKQSRVVSDN